MIEKEKEDKGLPLKNIGEVFKNYNWEKEMNEATQDEIVEKLVVKFSRQELFQYWLLLYSRKSRAGMQVRVLAITTPGRNLIMGKEEADKQLKKVAKNYKRLIETTARKLDVLERAEDTLLGVYGKNNNGSQGRVPINDLP